MTPLKEVTINMIQKLPDDCTVEDIMYEVNFIAQVYEGLEDAVNGRTISTSDLLKRVDEWSK